MDTNTDILTVTFDAYSTDHPCLIVSKQISLHEVKVVNEYIGSQAAAIYNLLTHHRCDDTVDLVYSGSVKPTTTGDWIYEDNSIQS